MLTPRESCATRAVKTNIPSNLVIDNFNNLKANKPMINAEKIAPNL